MTVWTTPYKGTCYVALRTSYSFIFHMRKSSKDPRAEGRTTRIQHDKCCSKIASTVVTFVLVCKDVNEERGPTGCVFDCNAKSANKFLLLLLSRWRSYDALLSLKTKCDVVTSMPMANGSSTNGDIVVATNRLVICTWKTLQDMTIV